MVSMLQDRKRYRVKKLCMDEPEELMEYEILRNKDMEGDIEIISAPERIFDTKLSKLYVVIEWME